MTNLVTSMRKAQSTMLAFKRLDTKMNGTDMLVKVRTLSKTTVTFITDKWSFFEMYNLPMLHGMVFLDETIATDFTLERSFALVLGTYMGH